MSGFPASDILKLLKEGNIAEAGQLASRAPPPNQSLELFAIAMLRLLEGSVEESTKCLVRAIRQNSVFIASGFYFELLPELRAKILDANPTDWVWLHESLIAMRDRDAPRAHEAAATGLQKRNCEEVRGVRARLFEAYCESGMLIWGESRWRKLQEAVETEMKMAGFVPWVALYWGALRYESDDPGAAACAFAVASSAEYEISHATRGCRSFVPYVEALPSHGRNTSFELDRRSEGSSGVVFAFCADEKYFLKFARNMCMSAVHHRVDSGLHFHLVNANADRIREEVAGWRSDFRPGLSFETSRHVSSSYYASNRFLNVTKLIDLYKSTIVMADVDAVFMNDASVYLKRLGENDVMLSIKGPVDSHFPWKQIPAGCVAIKDNSAGRKFAADIEQYLSKYFEYFPSHDAWWVDQNALSLAYKKFKGTDIKIGNVYAFGGSDRMPFDFAGNSNEKKEKFRELYQRKFSQ